MSPQHPPRPVPRPATHPATSPVLRPAPRRRRIGQPLRAPRTRPAALSGVGVLIALVTYAALAPWLHPVSMVDVDFTRASQAPSASAWFGTDTAGRDLFSLTASGLRVSLTIAALSTLVAAALGTAAGLLAAVTGGVVDRVLMRTVDALNSVPHLLLGIMLVTFYRGSLVAVCLSIALTHWTGVARIVRAQTLALRHSEHIAASITAGWSRWRVATAHLLPAVLPQAGVSAVLMLPHAIWHEATLSFLGLGVPPHEPSLGNLLNAAQEALLTGAWWTLVFPAALLMAATDAVSVSVGAARERTNAHGVTA